MLVSYHIYAAALDLPARSLFKASQGPSVSVGPEFPYKRKQCRHDLSGRRTRFGPCSASSSPNSDNHDNTTTTTTNNNNDNKNNNNNEK